MFARERMLLFLFDPGETTDPIVGHYCAASHNISFRGIDLLILLASPVLTFCHSDSQFIDVTHWRMNIIDPLIISIRRFDCFSTVNMRRGENYLQTWSILLTISSLRQHEKE